MKVIVRPMASPVLQRELPSDVRPIWPALVQQFDRVSQYRLLSLSACVDAETQRQVEAQEAAGLLPVIERAVADATIRPVYLYLTRAAAYIKLADATGARAHLRGFAGSPALKLSLEAPPVPPHQKLIAAHPLWLVMHVAIEAGLGTQLVGDVLDCGLRGRLAIEPELAAGLLLNALKYGDRDTLKLLLSEHIVLTPRARMRLDGDMENFVAELESRAQRKVALPALERQYLDERMQALMVLGETSVVQRLEAAAGQSDEGHGRRMAFGWKRFLPSAGRRNTAPLPPEPRTTAPQ